LYCANDYLNTLIQLAVGTVGHCVLEKILLVHSMRIQQKY